MFLKLVSIDLSQIMRVYPLGNCCNSVCLFIPPFFFFFYLYLFLPCFFCPLLLILYPTSCLMNQKKMTSPLLPASASLNLQSSLRAPPLLSSKVLLRAGPWGRKATPDGTSLFLALMSQRFKERSSPGGKSLASSILLVLSLKLDFPKAI